jgi:hypothetical protein
MIPNRFYRKALRQISCTGWYGIFRQHPPVFLKAFSRVSYLMAHAR